MTELTIPAPALESPERQDWADKHKAAISALEVLVVATIQNGESDRFVAAGRIAALGQKLTLEGTKRLPPPARNVRVCGQDDMELGDGLNFIAGPGMAPMYAARDPHDQGQEQMRMLQGVMAVLEPYVAGQHEQARASVRASRAAELRDLMASVDIEPALFDQLRRGARARLRELAKEIDGNDDEQGEKSDGEMVPAELLRRHQTREPGRQADDAHDPRPVAGGGARDGDPQEEGDGEGRLQGAVGDR